GPSASPGSRRTRGTVGSQPTHVGQERSEYYRAYKSLGYRGPAGSSLEAETQRRRSLTAPVALIGSQSRSAVWRSSRADAAPAEESRSGSAPNAVPGAAQEAVTSSGTANRPG